MLKDKILDYLNTSKYPTWSGCLAHCGISNYDLQQLELAAMSGVEGAVEDVKALDWFRLHLEAKLEEWLLYQDLHPDIKNRKINYENVKYLLRVSNPKKYGGAVYEIGGKPKEKTMNKLLKNESGVELVTNKIS